jgi:hypothetical protein
MSTNSKIGIQLECGKIRSISCHWDGHHKTVGKMLHEHYQDKAKVEKLIALGSLSYLEKEVDIPEGITHNFNKPAEGITVAYHRDRGEKFHTSYFISSEDFLGGLSYLFTKEGVWVIGTTFGGEQRLEDVLKGEGIIQ